MAPATPLQLRSSYIQASRASKVCLVPHGKCEAAMENTVRRWRQLRFPAARAAPGHKPRDRGRRRPLPSGAGPGVTGAVTLRGGKRTLACLCPGPLRSPSGVAITAVLTAWKGLGSGPSFLISWKSLCGIHTISSSISGRLHR